MRRVGPTKVVFLAGVVALHALPAFGSPCGGDCSVDAVTSVDELVACVNIALGVTEHDSCTSCDQGNDGVVSIDDLIDGVGRAVGGCQASFGQAAAGVAGSVVDAGNGYLVLDFGYLGSTGALRFPNRQPDGGGAGSAPCITCPGGGKVPEYDCVTAVGHSTMTAVLDGCSDGVRTRTGELKLEVDDAAFCRTCELLVGVSGTQTLSDYSAVEPDGTVIQIPGVLTEEFTITGPGCRGPNRPDKTSAIDGTLRMIGPQADVSFRLNRLTLVMESMFGGLQRCQLTTRQNGIIQVEDAVHDRRFLQTSRNFLFTQTTALDGAREVTIDTLRGGGFQVDCLGGEVQLETLKPLSFAAGAECASAGLMQVAFARGRRVVQIEATEGGGLAFDFDSDGTFDDEVPDCNDPSLSQCRVELPQLRPPAQPLPTGKLVVASDERPLTNLAFTTVPDTVAFVANLALWFTDGEAGRFHAYSNNLGLLQSSLAEVMSDEGHTWTTGTDLPFTIATLLAFDGIFSALNAPGIDLDVLTTYVRGGGSVYIAAGTSQDAKTTTDFWRPFLQRFGLDLEVQINVRSGIVPISSSHPIFAGVTALYHDGGQGVLATDSRAELIACSDGICLFGAYPGRESIVDGP